jgi:hypothetical protein
MSSFLGTTVFEGDVKIKPNVQPNTFGHGDLEVCRDVIIRGDLTVQGEQSDHQVTTFIVEDNIIAVGQPPTGAGKDGGMMISRHIDDITAGKVAESGTAQSGTLNTITLTAGANGTDDHYNNWYIQVVAGPGTGEKKVITDYTGATTLATVDSDWSVTPTAASDYELYNKARIGMIWDETNDEAAFIGTTDDHNALNPIINTYCDLHVRRIIQEHAQECVYYVGMHGDDADAGFHINEAKLTFGAAITAAAAETPDTNNQIVIVCFDACEYNEDLSIPEWIHVAAPNAKLTGTITLANNSSAKFREQTISSGTAVTKSATNGFASVEIDIMTLTSMADGVSNTGMGSTLKFANKKLEVEDGTAISSTNGSISAVLCDIEITGTGTAVNIATGATINLRASQITGSGTALAVSGTLNGHINKISATTAYNITAAGTNNLFIGEISGTETTAGTSNRLAAGVLTSKGDLLTRTATEYIRHGVGTDTYLLQSDSSTGTGLTWFDPAALMIPTQATYTLVKDRVKITNPNYQTIAYFPWLDSRYSSYTNGIIILRVAIFARDLEIRFRDVTNGVTLHASDPVVISASGSVSITLNANPASDASVELQARKSAPGGMNPEVRGCVLEYDN